MNRQPRRSLAAAAITLVAMSCSIVVDVELPKEGDDNDCAFLNRNRPAGVTECNRWQFNPVTLACELGPLDEDNDGFFPIVCLEPAGPTPLADIDCNDDINNGGDTVSPEAPEVCDGRDNDCDSRVDEGVMVPSISDGPTMDFNRDPDDLAFAVDPVAANTVGVAFSVRDPTAVPGVTVRPRDLASRDGVRFAVVTADRSSSPAAAQDPNTIVSAGVGIAALGGDEYAVAFINSSGGRRRVIAGVALATPANTLFVETSVFVDGLPCTAADGDCTVTRPPVDRPAVAVSGTDVLVTTVRRTATSAECDPAATAVTVVGNALTKRDYSSVALPNGGRSGPFPALRPTAANPLGFDVGMMRADASPAVIGLPAGGFVVALPQVNNTIVLRTVTVTDGVYAAAPTRDVTLRMGADELPLREPSMALGTAPDAGGAADPDQALAVAFTRGCGGAGMVQLKFFDVDATGALTARGPIVAVDGAGTMGTTVSEGRPSVAFADKQGSTWFVTFAKQSAWRGRVLSFDGTRHGDADSYALTPSSTGISLTPVAFGMDVGTSNSARFGAMFLATVNGPSALLTAHLSCPSTGD